MHAAVIISLASCDLSHLDDTDRNQNPVSTLNNYPSRIQ
jgi:hypothetical protein